jgi:hypothetical protein
MRKKTIIFLFFDINILPLHRQNKEFVMNCQNLHSNIIIRLQDSSRK